MEVLYVLVATHLFEAGLEVLENRGGSFEVM